jgi:hypothetical protein
LSALSRRFDNFCFNLKNRNIGGQDAIHLDCNIVDEHGNLRFIYFLYMRVYVYVYVYVYCVCLYICMHVHHWCTSIAAVSPYVQKLCSNKQKKKTTTTTKQKKTFALLSHMLLHYIFNH